MPRGVRISVFDVLASNKFVATEDQVGRLAEMNLSATQTQDSVRGVYLKVLVAGVQQDIGPVGRRKAGDNSEATEALVKVHERYYAAVLKAVTTPDIADAPDLEQEVKSVRALERNRRSNFARTARHVLNLFIKAGGNVHSLDPVKVTKRELQAFAASLAKPDDSKDTLAHKSTLAVDRVEEMARQLADTDKDAAVVMVEDAMAKLANLLAEFGRDSTAKATVAVREHRPLRLGENTFWPMTAVQ